MKRAPGKPAAGGLNEGKNAGDQLEAPAISGLTDRSDGSRMPGISATGQREKAKEVVEPDPELVRLDGMLDKIPEAAAIVDQ